MDIKAIKNINTINSYDANALDALVAKAHAGNSLLFIGAGFSLGSTNAINKPMPLASELSKQICNLGSFEEDEELSFSADYYLKHNHPEALINLLKKYFTVADVKDYHKHIANVNWRRVYTTNYDDCFELAAGLVKKKVYPFAFEDNASDNFSRKDLCVHINGAIQSLNNETIEKSFKLSESSYANPHAFSNSLWSYRFKKDLDACSQIVFVGYSLYDAEIKRLLVENRDIKRKTFFITSNDISKKEHHKLSAFGEIFPIGVKVFGDKISAYVRPEIPNSLDYFVALEKQELNYREDFSDSDIRNFLLRGKMDLEKIASSLTARDKLYSVAREQIDEIIDKFEHSDAVVIHGSIANGKSVTAEQVTARLLIEGRLVYKIYDDEAKYEDDIEALSQASRVYLVVDDFEQNLDIIKYFIQHTAGVGKLILTERPHRYRRAISELRNFGVDPYVVNIDYLKNREIDDVAQLISQVGLWGIRAKYSKDRQIKYLTKDCESQMSLILIELLESPNVKKIFKKSFSSILENEDAKKTVHAICVIQHIFPSKCTKSLISEIADTDHVYSSDFGDLILLSGLFEFSGNKILTRSSILSTFILSNFYKAAYTVEQLIRIVSKLQANRSQQSYEEREIYKSLMTFSTLAAILPEGSKPNSYIQFYERLKREVPGVIGNPHYWLQYSMSLMSADVLSDAERMLQTAFSKAENNPQYDTKYMDNQYARLKLKQAIAESSENHGYKLFCEAHSLLVRSDRDIFTFRQASLYMPYYEQQYAHLSKKNKVNFEQAMREITDLYREYLGYEYRDGEIPYFHKDSIEEFSAVIDKIAKTRN